MLLGAARHLAAIPDFSGTVYFIVQPAEENEGGGRRMIEEGLFRRFPMSAVYGLHNWPGQPFGTFAVKPGPLMAAYDIFELTLYGHGGHGAMPNETIDPIVIAGEVIGALQTIASRAVHPVNSAVVSVTQVHGGDAWNVIPAEVVLRGTTRSFKPDVQDRIGARIGEIARGLCAAHGATSTRRYERRYPATVNHADETEVAGRAAVLVANSDEAARL